MLLIASAFAATPVTSLREALTAHPGAELALSCDPVGPMVDLIGKLDLPGEGKAAELRALTAEGALQKNGVDPQGGLLFLARKPTDGRGDEFVWLRLGYVGTPDQVDTLNETFDLDLTRSGDGWTHAGAPFTLQDGVLSGGAWAPGPTAGVAPLLTGLADTPGCVVAITLPAEEQKALKDLVVQLPLNDAPIVARFTLDTPAPDVFAGAPNAIKRASSTRTPTAVATIGVPLNDVLDAVATTPLQSKVGNVDAIRKKVSFPDGMTFASFAPPLPAGAAPTDLLSQPPAFAVVTTIRDAKGKKIPPKALVKALTKDSPTVIDTGNGTLRVQVAALPLYVVFQKDGTVVVATSEALRDEVAKGGKEQWITPGSAHEQHAISMTGAWQDRRFDAFVGTQAGAWEVGISTGGHTLEDLITMVATFKTEMDRTSARAAVLSDLAGIRIAELAYHAEFDNYLPATDAPRSRDALTAAKVPWAPSDGFSALGWRPAQDTGAVYWVELTEGGFLVHARVDADGDGVPAEAISGPDDEPRWTTPDEVR